MNVYILNCYVQMINIYITWIVDILFSYSCDIFLYYACNLYIICVIDTTKYRESFKQLIYRNVCYPDSILI